MSLIAAESSRTPQRSPPAPVQRLHSPSSAAAPPLTSWPKSSCACGGSCHECRDEPRRLPIRPKLEIGAPGDALEREADRVADQVLRMPEPVAPSFGARRRAGFPAVQRAPGCACGGSCPACRGMIQAGPIEEPAGLQRQPIEEEEELLQPSRSEELSSLQRQEVEVGRLPVEEERLLQPSSRREPLAAVPGPPDHLADRIDSLRGSGAPLPEEALSFMEPRFGRDFGGVRVHTGPAAARLAAQIGARAFTVGRDVGFAPGRFDPGSTAGRRLLAHELTHVVQQGHSPRPRLARQPSAAPPVWCDPLKALVNHETRYGTLDTLITYHPANNSLLIPLNHDIPSIYGPVDVDWMLRLAASQYGPTIVSIFSPAIAQGLGFLISYSEYFLLKAFWNTVRSVAPEWDLEFRSVVQRANLNAPKVLVRWIQYVEPLSQIFAPALAQCP